MALAIAIAQHAHALTAALVDLELTPASGSIALACAGLAIIPSLTILSPSTTVVWSFRGPPSARL